MSYPRFNELSEADKARDWKAGITPEEYSAAKGARTEMLKTFGSSNGYKGTSSVSKASRIGCRMNAKSAPKKAA